MPVWERYDGTVTQGAAGSHANTEIFANAQADENFEAADVVAVDGILSVITDTDDLMGIRLIVAPEEMVSADMNEDVPQPHSRLVWYSWFAARGPMVFRLRSKKTVPAEHKLWVTVWKAQGGTSTILNWGLHVLWVVKH